METMKILLVGLSVLGIFASEAGAQIVREDHVDPALISPADPKNLPAQSPGARTSAGAVVSGTRSTSSTGTRTAWFPAMR